MLVCFYGSDYEKARAEARAFIERDGRTPERIIANEWYQGRCIEYADTESLFGGPQLYVLDTPSDNDTYAQEVFESLERLSASPHTFILIEHSLNVAETKKLIPHAKEIFEHKKPEKKDMFNMFSLADALASRDKKMLWVYLREAYGAGESTESIIGILLWQLKALAMTERTQTSSEAGMKDFPYKKAKKSLSNFSKGEVVTLFRSLLKVYHEGHGGVRNIDDALEQWVLSL